MYSTNLKKRGLQSYDLLLLQMGILLALQPKVYY
jgi:hypothetical protein